MSIQSCVLRLCQYLSNFYHSPCVFICNPALPLQTINKRLPHCHTCLPSFPSSPLPPPPSPQHTCKFWFSRPSSCKAAMESSSLRLSCVSCPWSRSTSDSAARQRSTNPCCSSADASTRIYGSKRNRNRSRRRIIQCLSGFINGVWQYPQFPIEVFP